MSFNPNQTPAVSQEDYFRNPSAALRYALKQRGMEPGNNFLAQRLLKRANEMVPLAYAYGADQGNFLDFAQRYAGSMFAPSSAQGEFSPGEIAKRVQGAYASGDESPMGAWLRAADQDNDPEVQQQRQAALDALTRRQWLPGLSAAAGAVNERKFESWYDQMLGSGGQSPYQTFIDYINGRPTPTKPAGADPGAPAGAAPPPGAQPGAAPPKGPGGPATPGGYGGSNPAQPAGSKWAELPAEYLKMMARGLPGQRQIQFGDGASYNPQADTYRASVNGHANANSAWRIFTEFYNDAVRLKPNASQEQRLRETLARLRRVLEQRGINPATTGFTFGNIQRD